MTPEELHKKVDDILGLVEDWDRNFLVREVQDSMATHFYKLSDKEVEEEWEFHFGRRNYIEFI